jgi:hypothetical protein
MKTNESCNESIIICPNCNEYVIIEKINCGIFRHATLKENGKQIEPHSSKQICENLLNNNLIYGCGKPFQIINNNGILEIFCCDYI